MSDDFTVDFDDTPIDAGKEPQQAVPEMKYYSHQEFEAAHPGLFQWLLNAKWSAFAQDLYLTLQYKGRLSDKQTQAAVQMRERANARDKAKATLQDAIAALPPDYPVLANSFLTASRSLKNPKLRLETPTGRKVVLSRCGMSSRTPGEISMADGRPFGSNTYYGRITPQGRAYWRNLPDNILDEVKALLKELEVDPKAAMLVQGQRTGSCCICGKALTNSESVALGIGPICGGRWGL